MGSGRSGATVRVTGTQEDGVGEGRGGVWGSRDRIKRKMNPCPGVINQGETKTSGGEQQGTRIIQFHGRNINNEVRGS